MSRTVYLNGEYIAEENAKVSIFDRGFLFADGVYEVTSVMDGKLLEFDGHCARLERSLNELGMKMPMDRDAWLEVHRELVKRNDLENGMIYLQVTRGAEDRDFAWSSDLEQTIVLFTQTKDLRNSPAAAKGLKVISLEDQRWGRRDIKTVQLLYPSMCKMQAKAAGVDDAWLVEDGTVNEGSSNNAYIVKDDGTVVTRNLSNAILHGITRASVLRYAKEAQVKVEERPFTIEEAQSAAEAFVTSASTFVTGVIEIDGAKIGDGTPGPVSKRLREIYLEESEKAAI